MKHQQQLATDTVVLGSDYGEARVLTTALVEELSRSVVERRLELPSLPEVALKIRKAIADENVSASEIVRLLGADPALAARILKTANSAMFYRGNRPITNLHPPWPNSAMVRTSPCRMRRNRCSSATAANKCAATLLRSGSTACTRP
jgi:hypothetical protein